MIDFFPQEHIASSCNKGLGYVTLPHRKRKRTSPKANSAKPRFRSGQMMRMERFYAETRYVLRIENTIEI